MAATIATQRRRVQFAFTALILLFILALIALLKCKREHIPEVIRALAFWWEGVAALLTPESGALAIVLSQGSALNKPAQTNAAHRS